MCSCLSFLRSVLLNIVSMMQEEIYSNSVMIYDMLRQIFVEKSGNVIGVVFTMHIMIFEKNNERYAVPANNFEEPSVHTDITMIEIVVRTIRGILVVQVTVA